MKTRTWLCVLLPALFLAAPSMAMAGKGFMGGGGTVVVDEPADDSGGLPDDVEGPLNDKMADAGKLFGDLYVILRQQGVAGDQKLVPAVDSAGDAVIVGEFQIFTKVTNDGLPTDPIVGGEPVLTVIDPGDTNALADYGWYAAEIGVNLDESPIYGAAQSPYPAMCVQPVASYERWGDISSKTGLSKNRLPLVITYDPTWGRSECEVGQLVHDVNGDPMVTVDPVTGELTMEINDYFIEPGGTWADPNNGKVTYLDGVLWTDLIGEVHFGRLNLSRAPEAVLQAAFDEAINNINSPDTIAIEIDAAGRLLLTKILYDEILVDPDTGLPLELAEPVKKAIDSPLENIALYVKLMQDGHLVTPGDERLPIDRSKNGGIPIWKLLELEDGPSEAALRPTIDIAKMRNWGMGSMVDVSEVEYLTYYDCVDSESTPIACLCVDPNPVQPELSYDLIACDGVVGRTLSFVTGIDLDEEDDCPVSSFRDLLPESTDEYYNDYECEGPFTGIMTDDNGLPDAADLTFAASFLSAAGDKTGDFSVDMVVYLNSILGINKVLGTSEDGTVDYEKNPVYFNFRDVIHNRNIYKDRGQVAVEGGNGAASSYDGKITVLWGGEVSGIWAETEMQLLDRRLPWDYVVWEMKNDKVTNSLGTTNIRGFTQMADDNLSIIKFIHTYQIPGLR